MSKADTLENDVLRKVFNATNPAWDAIGTLYVSLHTADPGEAGTQATNETAYTGYARVGVPRSTGGWSVAANEASNVAAVLFPLNGGVTTPTVTHVGVGTASSGAGTLLYSGSLTANLLVGAAVEPNFPAGQLKLQEG